MTELRQSRIAEKLAEQGERLKSTEDDLRDLKALHFDSRLTRLEMQSELNGRMLIYAVMALMLMLIKEAVLLFQKLLGRRIAQRVEHDET